MSCSRIKVTRLVLGLWAMEHGPFLLAVAAEYAGPSMSAEDIVQEAFLTILRKLEQLDEVSSPRAFLLAYVRNVGRNLRRKRTRRRAMLQIGLLDHEVPTDGSRIFDWRMEAVLAALRTLPARQQETLRHTLAGMSDDQIAESLEITRATVRSNRHRAIRTLQALLSG